MKALVRKNPYTPTRPEQDEVYLPPWQYYINTETGAPLTDENYGYALCTDIPDDVDRETLTVKNFIITEHTKEVPSDYPDEPPMKVRYWTAKYTPEETV